jgi:ParB-like chromosome segregation protein Spo0J
MAKLSPIPPALALAKLRTRFDVHPAADDYPMIDEAALTALAEDIGARGLMHPIEVMTNPDGAEVLVDGRNRFTACLIAGVAPELKELDIRAEDVEDYVLSLNVKRRHLSAGARALAAARWLARHSARVHSSEGEAEAEAKKGPSAQAAAARFDVSRRSVFHAKAVLECDDPALTAAAEQGVFALSLAAELAGLDAGARGGLLAGDVATLRARLAEAKAIAAQADTWGPALTVDARCAVVATLSCAERLDVLAETRGLQKTVLTAIENQRHKLAQVEGLDLEGLRRWLANQLYDWSSSLAGVVVAAWRQHEQLVCALYATEDGPALPAHPEDLDEQIEAAAEKKTVNALLNLPALERAQQQRLLLTRFLLHQRSGLSEWTIQRVRERAAEAGVAIPAGGESVIKAWEDKRAAKKKAERARSKAIDGIALLDIEAAAAALAAFAPPLTSWEISTVLRLERAAHGQIRPELFSALRAALEAAEVRVWDCTIRGCDGWGMGGDWQPCLVCGTSGQDAARENQVREQLAESLRPQIESDIRATLALQEGFQQLKVQLDAAPTAPSEEVPPTEPTRAPIAPPLALPAELLTRKIRAASTEDDLRILFAAGGDVDEIEAQEEWLAAVERVFGDGEDAGQRARFVRELEEEEARRGWALPGVWDAIQVHTRGAGAGAWNRTVAPEVTPAECPACGAEVELDEQGRLPVHRLIGSIACPHAGRSPALVEEILADPRFADVLFGLQPAPATAAGRDPLRSPGLGDVHRFGGAVWEVVRVATIPGEDGLELALESGDRRHTCTLAELRGLLTHAPKPPLAPATPPASLWEPWWRWTGEALVEALDELPEHHLNPLYRAVAGSTPSYKTSRPAKIRHIAKKIEATRPEIWPALDSLPERPLLPPLITLIREGLPEGHLDVLYRKIEGEHAPNVDTAAKARSLAKRIRKRLRERGSPIPAAPKPAGAAVPVEALLDVRGDLAAVRELVDEGLVEAAGPAIAQALAALDAVGEAAARARGEDWRARIGEAPAAPAGAEAA